MEMDKCTIAESVYSELLEVFTRVIKEDVEQKCWDGLNCWGSFTVTFVYDRKGKFFNEKKQFWIADEKSDAAEDIYMEQCYAPLVLDLFTSDKGLRVKYAENENGVIRKITVTLKPKCKSTE